VAGRPQNDRAASLRQQHQPKLIIGSSMRLLFHPATRRGSREPLRPRRIPIR
jgi:hypothetical protein